MSKIVPLNNEIYSKLKVTSSSDYSRFKEQQLIPIVIQDFVLLATEFPIVFVKNSDNGQFIPVAMMGLKSGVNLYCQNTMWTCPVTPIGFNNAPFSLVKNNNNSEEVIVCIDLESSLVDENSGSALFDKQGEQTDYLKQRSQALLQAAEFNLQTQAVTQLFTDKKLLCARQLTVNLGSENEPLNINGIYLIDEKVLNELPKEDFERLRTKGLLPVIYAHLASIHQIGRLTIKQNKFDEQS